MLPLVPSARLTTAALVCLFCASYSYADDWPQWLGPNRDGVWKEEGLLETFPKDGPKVLWKKPINPGYSGPAILGDRIVTMDRIAKAPDPKAEKGSGLPGTDRVVCLDFKTGDTLWTHEYETTYQKVDRPMGPRTTPTIEGDKVYTLGTMGELFCLNLKDGKPIWSKNFKKDYSATPPVWGHSAHLLIEKDLLIALVGGGEGQAVVAFDKATGQEKWKALTSSDVGYAAPVMAEAGGVRQLIVWLSDALAGLNPTTGEVYWRHPHPEKGKMQQKPTVTIVTPKVVGDRVYISSAYDGMLAVKLNKEKPTAEIEWREEVGKKGADPLRFLMTSIIAKEGHLYGIVADNGEVICADAKTGKAAWKSQDLFGGKDALFGSAFWVENGERVFCFTDAGDLAILKLTPKKYEELGRVLVMDPIGADRGRKVIWSHPAFAQKSMVFRNEKEIVCLSLAK